MTATKMSKEWQAILATPFSDKVQGGMKIPTHATDVTKEFIDAALRRIYGLAMPRVSAISKKTPSKQGLMSDVAFIEVSYDDQQQQEKNDNETDETKKSSFLSLPKSLVAKGSIVGQEEMLKMGFANEVAFYTHVPSDVWSARPAVYFCEGALLIMDRVSGSNDGGDSLDLFSPLDNTLARKVITMLARLHAATWRDAPVTSGKESDDKFDIKGVMPRRSLKPMLPLFVNGTIGDLSLVFSVFEDAAKKASRPDDESVMRAFKKCAAVEWESKLEKMFEQMWYPDDCPDSLVLGDVKQDNCFVLGRNNKDEKDDKFDVVLIDFQGLGWGPSTADIFFWMCIGFEPKKFSELWEEDLRSYWEQLQEFARTNNISNKLTKETYNFEMCRRHFRGSVASLLISCCILAKKVKDQEEKFEEKMKEEKKKGDEDDHDDEKKKKKVDEERAKLAHERRLSEMVFVKWICAMDNLGVVEDVEKL